jgi:hypothetical protein
MSSENHTCKNCGCHFNFEDHGWGVSMLGTCGTDFCADKCYREYTKAHDKRTKRSTKALEEFTVEEASNTESHNSAQWGGCIGFLIAMGGAALMYFFRGSTFIVIVGVILIIFGLFVHHKSPS